MVDKDVCLCHLNDFQLNIDLTINVVTQIHCLHVCF